MWSLQPVHVCALSISSWYPKGPSWKCLRVYKESNHTKQLVKEKAKRRPAFLHTEVQIEDYCKVWWGAVQIKDEAHEIFKRAIFIIKLFCLERRGSSHKPLLGRGVLMAGKIVWESLCRGWSTSCDILPDVERSVAYDLKKNLERTSMPRHIVCACACP